MTTALVRKCDVCHAEIPDGRAFVLSRFDLQRADGAPAVVAEPRDICSAECFYALMRSLFEAAMTDERGVAGGLPSRVRFVAHPPARRA